MSTLTPNLSKNLQEQLFAQLPPTQAKKLSRTLSVQNDKDTTDTTKTARDYLRSMSTTTQDIINRHTRDSVTPTNEVYNDVKESVITNNKNWSSLKKEKISADAVNNNTWCNEYSRFERQKSLTSSKNDCDQFIRNCVSPTSILSDTEKVIYSPEPVEKRSENSRLKKLEQLRSTQSVLQREKSVGREIADRSLSLAMDGCTSSGIKKHLSGRESSVDPDSSERSMKEKLSRSKTPTNPLATLRKLNGIVAEEEKRIPRPKSCISKGSIAILEKTIEDFNNETIELSKAKAPSKLSRPKSFPNSKLTPPKDIIYQIPIDEPSKASVSSSNLLTTKTSTPTPEETKTEPSETAPVLPKKVKKIVKKKAPKATPEGDEMPKPPVVDEKVKKEASPEKKMGLLHALGQKFEKLRDFKVKDKKEVEVVTASVAMDNKERKKKIKAMMSEEIDDQTRKERKSKIDAMIKNLKEKSLPQKSELTESGLIKRAVSVEEMPDTFNKKSVNKVLGMFAKRFEKESPTSETKVLNTKSTSHLSGNENDLHAKSLEWRPKSGSFMPKLRKNSSGFDQLNNIAESKIPVKHLSSSDYKVADVSEDSLVNKRSTLNQKISLEEKERIRNNRKGLMLDLSSSSHSNTSFPPPLPSEMARTPLSPTYDSLTNYSSSPSNTLTDDIGHDRWSTCSEDDYQHLVPGGSSRLSRNLSDRVTIDESNPAESVVDRIRRKSFYTRFNEKKAKRVSNIVGPAAKEYYRERSRPLEYTKSATSVMPDLSSSYSSGDNDRVRSHSITRSAVPTIPTSRSLSQTRESSKVLTENGSDTSQPSSSIRRYAYDTRALTSLPPIHHHHHPNHFRTSPDPCAARTRSHRSTIYDFSTPTSTNLATSLYSNRRSYISTAPTYSSISSFTPKTPSFVDSYATLGRKPRQYNTRTVSLLDSSNMEPRNSYAHVDLHRRDYSDLHGACSR